MGVVHSVQLEWESDSENAGATGRISAVDHEFPEDPGAWDDETEERWEHAMDHVHPAIVLLGHPETERPARTAYPQPWTVVMTYREPSGAGGFQRSYKMTGVRHVMARSEDEARRLAGHRINQDLTGSSFGGVEVTVIASLAGMLTPDGEEADEQRDPGLPVLVVEMAHGRIDSITADRAMRLLVVETDGAADVHLPVDATRSDVERTLDEHTPAWRAPDRIEMTSLVEDHGASWIAETRRKLSQRLDTV
ncbi:hypothetical protein CKO28_00650 [Rhodovibrio sodomensis]|uniref:Uncharacterized protein n=1 Tax=Rhodovibrio sodomensis TaxID=1088 RepID=A0ABS1D861_9PROT|nr:hypothetical protein [Rhodovibrio sodomensis]MBK1666550.1 hypothetical protein [Rhodovibrio sodomensis]